MTTPYIWQRWFAGPFDFHRAPRVGPADLAVTVIGFRAQRGLIAAIKSLLAQDTRAEIIVVNSGGGDAVGLLTQFHDHITIINIETPLRVGAARNIGIDASCAPYIAFLAGDCLAKPFWVSARLKHHRKGNRAVASAIALPETKHAIPLSAHCLLFGLRSPQVRSLQALRYGASYAREVFAEFGYFNTHMRIAEDSAFAQRLGRTLFPIWAPDVQTEHKNPTRLHHLIADMYARGARAARSAEPASGFKHRLAKAKQRAATARTVAQDLIGLSAATLFALRAPLAFASLAYEWGLDKGRRKRAKVDLLLAQAELSEAPRTLLEEALYLDPESIRLHLRLAELALATDQQTAHDHIEAIALACFHAPHAARLADWLSERGLDAERQTLAQRLAYCLPTASLSQTV